VQHASGDGWFVEVTGQPLELLKYTQLVTHPAAGAISSFVGITRNSFNGKAVLRLEYEAYVPMALAKLQVRVPCFEREQARASAWRICVCVHLPHMRPAAGLAAPHGTALAAATHQHHSHRPAAPKHRSCVRLCTRDGR
jgi:hypothetical protein